MIDRCRRDVFEKRNMSVLRLLVERFVEEAKRFYYPRRLISNTF